MRLRSLAVTVMLASVFGTPAMSQTTPPTSPTTPAAARAFSGVWWGNGQVSGLVPMDGTPVPLSAEGKRRFLKNVADLKSGELVDQADYKCVPQGMPRAMTGAYPFQIMVTPGLIVFAHEQNRAYRIVALSDHHQDPKIWDPSYMGDGIAHLDGNELTIDSTNFKSEAIFIDASGVPASTQLHLVERLSLLDGGKRLQDLITIDDPEMFSRTWTARRVFSRRDDVTLRTDWICGEPHRPLPSSGRSR